MRHRRLKGWGLDNKKNNDLDVIHLIVIYSVRGDLTHILRWSCCLSDVYNNGWFPGEGCFQNTWPLVSANMCYIWQRRHTIKRFYVWIV